jgi:predicted Fe-S protein YdhL (DUF1289 family)
MELCEGCLRTLDEIGAWDSMGAEEKWSVLDAVEERRSRWKGGDPTSG